MSPITIEEALQQVDPSLDDTVKGDDGYTARTRSALAIVRGVAANDAYWDSRTQLEQYVARAQGHGQVVRDPSGESASALPTDPTAGSIEGTAVEVPPAGLSPGETPPAAQSDADKLREQLRAAGLTPEA